MKRRNKGRKIYKTKEKNYYGKSPMGKFLSGALTVLLIGGIGFLGYSVAEPIINYTQHKGDEPEATEQPTAGPVTKSTISVTKSAAETVNEPKASEYYTAAALAVSDMTSIDTLRAAIAAIPQNEGIEYVELPLKVQGGGIYYSSSIPEAQIAGAVKSTLALSEAVQEIQNGGFKPSAVISVFYDNIMPVSYSELGYTVLTDGSQWYDNDIYNGGKPWTSPYSQRALDYNANIVMEASSAGFEQIICSDFVFPVFRESDLQILDPVLAQSDRCIAMTSAANLFYDKAMSNGASMQIEVSAEDILSGRADILQPMLLSSNNIILNIDLDKLSNGISNGNTLYEFKGTPAENIEKCLGFVNDKLVDFNVAIRLSGASMTSQELLEAKEIASDYGYEAFVIG